MQRPHLRPKCHEPVCSGSDVQWFDPATVAREEQTSGALVPDCESEHSVQTFGKALAPLLPAVDQDFGV